MPAKQLGPFLGMNNKLEDYAMHVKDTGDYVADAQNVAFSNTGRIFRAEGHRLITSALAGGHSLWAYNERAYYVLDSDLYRINTFEPFASTLITALSDNTPVSFIGFADEVWFSNGTDFGRLSAADVLSLHAIDTPSAPTLTAVSGSLTAGDYQVSISGVDASGRESGATKPVSVTLAATGGILVTLPSAPTGATHFQVYVTSHNGTILNRHATVAAGTASVLINTPVLGAEPSTLLLQPLPPGKLALHNGRMLSWSGNTLYYSEPWMFGLYNPAKNYITMPADISVVAPNQFCVYIASDITRSIVGMDIAAPEAVKEVFPYGAVPGNAFHHPDKPLVGWVSHKGIVIGDLQGQATNIQEKALAYDLRNCSHAATLAYDYRGTSLLRVGLT